MSTRSRNEKSQKESAAWVDKGAFMGSFAAAVVLGLWAVVYFGEQSDEQESQQDATPPPTPVASSQQEDPELPPEPVEPAYMQGIRDAIALGKEGIADSEKALKWNEEVGGDPFKFANMMEEAAAKVTRASTALDALRSDAEGDTTALKRIDQWVNYFDDNVPRRKK